MGMPLRSRIKAAEPIEPPAATPSCTSPPWLAGISSDCRWAGGPTCTPTLETHALIYRGEGQRFIAVLPPAIEGLLPATEDTARSYKPAGLRCFMWVALGLFDQMLCMSGIAERHRCLQVEPCSVMAGEFAPGTLPAISVAVKEEDANRAIDRDLSDTGMSNSDGDRPPLMIPPPQVTSRRLDSTEEQALDGRLAAGGWCNALTSVRYNL
ncbi:predicted protein [Postia placenta Mad-698-R]|nr:predicted protein [Postia placenta Mad-698-R]